jgi:hypothetical protein
MDLRVVKLTVDRMIDPSADVAAVTKQIDDMAARRQRPVVRHGSHPRRLGR